MSENFKTGFEIFPIKTATSCMLKWTWSTINMETAMTSSCHRSTYHPINLDNFEDFHNLPGKIKEREAMIRGEWPVESNTGSGCNYCKRIESNGGVSDRIMTLSRHHTIDKVPPELLENSSVTHVTPTILEIYFNNTCNLSCVYCNTTISSKFNDEVRKFGPIEISGFEKKLFVKQHDQYNTLCNSLWKYLENQNKFRHIRHFHILGGEPFMQKELDHSINFWESHPNPNLTINIVSNLMIDHDRFQEKISRFASMIDSNKIYQLQLTASIDSWGAEQEYVRHGIDLDLFEKNFKYLLDKHGIHASIHSCVSLLTIKGLPNLFKKINEWNKINNPIDYAFDVVLGARHMLPTNAGPELFKQDFINALNLMPTENENQITVKQQLSSLVDFVNTKEKNSESLALLKTYLSELDRRRNTDWRSVFPWLVNA